uniref:Uncharacterized protein n=1 Tax=Eutreptiella gymnastica TaxID=73025 RepID=A0A7S1HU75_9EUGL|mmetsp:Transcript_105971/g.182755  ORF Transcript_105971/g.182755 Transcript_105971/m.182755 type:complete len:497 (+) Transcript_105971:64-1554(+)
MITNMASDNHEKSGQQEDVNRQGEDYEMQKAHEKFLQEVEFKTKQDVQSEMKCIQDHMHLVQNKDRDHYQTLQREQGQQSPDGPLCREVKMLTGTCIVTKAEEVAQLQEDITSQDLHPMNRSGLTAQRQVDLGQVCTIKQDPIYSPNKTKEVVDRRREELQQRLKKMQQQELKEQLWMEQSGREMEIRLRRLLSQREAQSSMRHVQQAWSAWQESHPCPKKVDPMAVTRAKYKKTAMDLESLRKLYGKENMQSAAAMPPESSTLGWATLEEPNYSVSGSPERRLLLSPQSARKQGTLPLQITSHIKGQETPTFWVVDGDNVFDSCRVRQMPSLHAPEVRKPLPKGTVVEELTRYRDWVRHQEGWSVISFEGVSMLRICDVPNIPSPLQNKTAAHKNRKPKTLSKAEWDIHTPRSPADKALDLDTTTNATAAAEAAMWFLSHGDASVLQSGIMIVPAIMPHDTSDFIFDNDSSEDEDFIHSALHSYGTPLGSPPLVV